MDYVLHYSGVFTWDGYLRANICLSDAGDIWCPTEEQAGRVLKNRTGQQNVVIREIGGEPKH